MNAQDYEARRKITMLKSQVDRLEGKFDGLIEHVKDQDKKIERLQRNQLPFTKIGS
jgi:hypothetical protein